MKILAIETSCDETGIAIVERQGSSGALKTVRVLANITLSQANLHAKYGGVFPSLARREHAKSIVPLVRQALIDADLAERMKSPHVLTTKEERALAKIFHKESELFAHFKEVFLPLKKPALDAIAVTTGPGLEPALWVGINTAQALGTLWGIPVIPVNHMEGHIVTALLAPNSKQSTSYHLQDIQYPAIALLISGGHTELVLMSKHGAYRILGQTRDDAVGEAFDKVARMLGLSYPGGPEISRLAEKAPANPTPRYPLPRPMIKSGDFDFSFAGLKTAVLYTLKNIINPTEEDRACIAKEFEDAATEVLVAKTLVAAKKYKAREIVLGGGVTANKKIREAFRESVTRDLSGVKLFIPDCKLSTDNGLMIGIAGLLRGAKPRKKITADGTLRLAKSVRS